VVKKKNIKVIRCAYRTSYQPQTFIICSGVKDPDDH